MKTEKPRVLIGVVGFNGIVPEAGEHFARFFYRLGKEWSSRFDFILEIEQKREQFRARNSLVEKALGAGCEYMLQVDDDTILNTNTFGELLKVLEDDPKAGIVGALYVQRGAPYRPVLLDGRQTGKDMWHTSWIPYAKVERRPMQVTVAGGGCMLFRMEMFRKMSKPYFWVDGIMGTDVQISTKAKEEGWNVYVHGGHEVGHVTLGQIVYPSNLPYEIMKYNELCDEVIKLVEENTEFMFTNVKEAAAWAQMEYQRIWQERDPSGAEAINAFYMDPYVQDIAIFKGAAYACSLQPGIDHYQELMKLILFSPLGGYALDYGCGIGMGSRILSKKYITTGADLPGKVLDIAKKIAPTVDFVDVREVDKVPPWKYDFILLIDVLEHLTNPREVLNYLCEAISPGGNIFTNCHLYNFKGSDEGIPQHLNLIGVEEIEEIFNLHRFEQDPRSPFLLRKG